MSLAAAARLPAHQLALGPVLGYVDFCDPNLVAARIAALKVFDGVWTFPRSTSSGMEALQVLLGGALGTVRPTATEPPTGGRHSLLRELAEDRSYLLLFVDASSNWEHANFAGALEGFRRFRAARPSSELELLVILRRGPGAAHLRTGIARDHADLAMHVAQGFVDLDQLGPLVRRADAVLDCARHASYDSVLVNAALSKTSIVATASPARSLDDGCAWWIPVEPARAGAPVGVSPDQVASTLSDFETASAFERDRRSSLAHQEIVGSDAEQAFAQITQKVSDYLSGRASWSPGWAPSAFLTSR